VASEFRAALVVLFALSVATGVIYPLAVTGVAHVLFPQRASGSLIEVNGRIVGSALIGQPFSEAKYFWPRPSATAPFPYNAAASSGTNQGPLNPALIDAVEARIAALRAADPTQTASVPVDLVTASASGLDPDISPAAAAYQLPRVARARGLSENRVRALLAQYTAGRQWLTLGEPRVNVLRLNLALDALAQQ
jgi:K+-transporting ATPase ATPase C chain